ncbi:MAG: DOMON-like domain-containing protein [Phormidesmis sp.]
MPDTTIFTLRPFEPLPSGIKLNISGTLTRSGDTLSIAYLMSGDLDQVLLPPLNVSSQRKDRLWEQTCLEFFLAAGPVKSDSAPYWEFNLAPTGSWNVFALASYRQGLKEEKAFLSLPFSASRTAAELRLRISLDISVLLPAASPWLLGVSAVCLLADGQETFWAIAHPGPNADFHSAGSFAATLSL